MYMYIVLKKKSKDNYYLLVLAIKISAFPGSGSDQVNRLPLSGLQRQLR